MPASAAPALVLALPLAGIAAASFVQMIYLVPRVYDSLVGWDLVGKVMAYEGVYRSSVFDKIAFNAQATYPPITACLQGLFYIFTPSAPRLWVPVMLLAFLICFGEEARRMLRSVVLALALLLAVFTVPELNFHLTVAQTDFPNMVFVSLAFAWALRYPGDRRALLMTAVFLLLGTMTRSETVLPAAGVWLWMILRERRRWLAASAVVVGPVLFFALWNIVYVRHVLGYDPAAHFRKTLDVDPARAWEVVRLAVLIASDRETYGELPLVFLGGVAVWAGWVATRRRSRRPEPSPAGRGAHRQAGAPGDPSDAGSPSAGSALALLLLAFVLYLPFFYQWDPVLNPLWTMEHTFKRGFFRYVPLMTLFVAMTVRSWGDLLSAGGPSGERKRRGRIRPAREASSRSRGRWPQG